MDFERFSPRYYERLARGWERWVSVALVALLLVPIPFVRFETWPGGGLLWQQPAMPWSRFRICYLAFPEGSPVEAAYRFRWEGFALEPEPKIARPLAIAAAGETLLQWQDRPEVALTELEVRGDLLWVKTSWQPLLFWPFRMLQESWRQGLGIPGTGPGAGR